MSTVTKQNNFPARLDLSMYRGSAFSYAVIWLNGATTATAAPYDISAYTPRAHLRDTDSAATLRKFTAAVSAENGPLSYTDPVTRATVNLGTVDYWKITISMTREETAAIEGDSLDWELEFAPEGDDSEPPTIFAGLVSVSGEVGTDAEYA